MTIPSRELPPGTVIELPAIDDRRQVYTLRSREVFGDAKVPGWYVFDHEEGDVANLFDASIDRGYRIVGEAVDATVGYVEPSKDDEPEQFVLIKMNMDIGPRVQEILGLPNDRWGELEITFGHNQIGFARVSLYLTPDQLIQLAQLGSHPPKDAP